MPRAVSVGESASDPAGVAVITVLARPKSRTFTSPPGVLVGAGKGDLTPVDVGRLLQKESPLPAQLTAPLAGQLLERVDY